MCPSNPFTYPVAKHSTPLKAVAKRSRRALFLLMLAGASLAVHAQPSVQVAWEGSPTRPLLNSAGVALSAGTAASGDGTVLQLGYYSGGSASTPFVGTFIPLTGEGSPDVVLQKTSIGDSGVSANGGFSVSTNFNAGTAVFQGIPPAAGTPLVIRFYDSTSIATAKNYNAVSGGVNWQWKAPTEAPGSFVILSLADPSLTWLGGALSKFRTAIPVPAGFTAPPAGSPADSQEIPAIVGGALSFVSPARSTPATYVATGLPDGLRLNTLTGAVTGVPTKPGNYRLVITPINRSRVFETPMQYNIVVAPLSSGVVGSFSGLIQRSPTLNANLGGALQITTTLLGAFSAKITVGSRSFASTGKLGVDGSLPTQATLYVSLAQLAPGLNLTLTFDGVTQTLSGTFWNGSDSALVSGEQNPWSRTFPANSLQGSYAFRLQQGAEVAGSPQGYSFGVLTVAPTTGSVVANLTLADSTRVTASTQLGKSGEVDAYAAIAAPGAGSWIGAFTLAPGALAPANNTLSGSASWLRTARTGTVYAAAFGPLQLDAVGGTVAAVAKGGLVMGLNAVTKTAAQNAQLSFTGGGLNTEGREFSRLVAVVNPSSTGVTNTATVEAGTINVTLPTLNASTGAFSGTFTIPGTTAATTRAVPFQGQLVTTDGHTEGYGFFLLPALTGASVTTSPKLSGRVLFAKP